MQPAGLAGVNDQLRICGGSPMRKHGRMTTETQSGRDVIAQFIPHSPFVAKLGIVADQPVMAAAWCGAEAPPELRGVTVSMTLDFMAPARATDVIGVGRVLRRGRLLTNCEAEIVDPEGRLLAKALATYKVG